MLLETATLSLHAQFGIATLALRTAVTARPTLRDLARALAAVAASPGLDVLVVRGLTGDTAAPSLGQSCVRRLLALRIPTVAYLDGPCLGPAWELALACRHRLAAAHADTRVGLPAGPCGWGGTQLVPRLMGLRAGTYALHANATFTGAEALRAGLVDRAYGPRLAPVKLLDYALQLQAHPSRPRRQWSAWDRLTGTRWLARQPSSPLLELVRAGYLGGLRGGFAAERAYFRGDRGLRAVG